MSKIHEVQSVRPDREYLYLTVDGRSYQIRWEDCSPRLAQATMEQRRIFEVAPSGYGIHWSEIDEDLAITPSCKLPNSSRWQRDPVSSPKIQRACRQASLFVFCPECSPSSQIPPPQIANSPRTPIMGIETTAPRRLV